VAEEGRKVDGASIPWLLWNKWVGPPFVGDYRRASVVHDTACEDGPKAADSSQTVHRMFYDACLAGGVGRAKAKVMYWAVRTFGPKWGDQDTKNVLTQQQHQELLEIDKQIRALGITENSSKKEINRAIKRIEAEQAR
jgi:hypothetical protein